jgi:phage-related minor tail protein
MTAEAPDAILARLAALDGRLTAIEEAEASIVRSLLALGGTLGTHTEMLARLLEAATDEGTEGRQLHDALEHIFASLNTQTGLLADIAIGLRRLPALTADEIEGRYEAAPPPPVPADAGDGA